MYDSLRRVYVVLAAIVDRQSVVAQGGGHEPVM